jgi:hypothetical protein
MGIVAEKRYRGRPKKARNPLTLRQLAVFGEFRGTTHYFWPIEVAEKCQPDGCMRYQVLVENGTTADMRM